MSFGYAPSDVSALSWTHLTLANSWTGHGAPAYTPAWAKSASGLVYLRGALNPAATPATAITIAGALPSGARPTQEVDYWLQGQVPPSGLITVILTVTAAGVIQCQTPDGAVPTTSNWISLDGIIFSTSAD